MTSTFYMKTPAARSALKWLSVQVPAVTKELKENVTFFRFEPNKLVLGVNSEKSMEVLILHEREISEALISGYRDQGDLDIREVCLELPD